LTATLVAIPIALLAFFVVFQVLKPISPVPSSSPTPSPRTIPTGPVEIAPAALDEHQATVCKTLIARLPSQVRDLPRRPVTGASDQAGAYGELLLRCGGPKPSFPPTDFVFDTTGVCWHPDAGGTTWTTVDREVPITLTLPPYLAGDGSAQWAAALAPVIGTNVQATPDQPSGCP